MDQNQSLFLLLGFLIWLGARAEVVEIPRTFLCHQPFGSSSERVSMLETKFALTGTR